MLFDVGVASVAVFAVFLLLVPLTLSCLFAVRCCWSWCCLMVLFLFHPHVLR